MTTPIGFIYQTAMPDLTDVADIQEALRIYHYGAPTGVGEGFYNPTNTDPTNLVVDSVAYHIYNLQEQLGNFTTGILPTAWTEKGVLISADAPGSPVKLDPGGPGQVLTINSGTLTGLEWKTIDLTLDNEATVLNKTFGLVSILQPGIKFLGNTGNEFHTYLSSLNPTGNRQINLPNVDGTVITTGNISDIVGNLTSAAPFNVRVGNVPILTVADNLNGNIELGRRDSVVSTPHIDFHSSGNNVDYDVRLVATGGSSTLGRGNLKIDGNLVNNLNTTPKTAAYALQALDFNTIVQMNGAFTFEVNNTLLTTEPGTQITLIALTAGVSVTQGTGVSLLATPGTKLRGAGSVATLICLGPNSWVLSGDLIP
jgi:hypothetical protein